MRRYRIWLLAAFIIVLLTACAGKEAEAEENTVFVSAKGAVVGAIVEDFGEPYYNAEELRAMIDQVIADYEKISGEKDGVLLESFEVSDGKARVYLKYALPADYKSFNGKELYCGTVASAYEAGYSFDVVFTDHTLAAGDQTDGAEADKNAVLEKGKYHIVILEEPIRVSTGGRIVYTTANVNVLGKKLAQVNPEKENGELAYIIYK